MGIISILLLNSCLLLRLFSMAILFSLSLYISIYLSIYIAVSLSLSIYIYICFFCSFPCFCCFLMLQLYILFSHTDYSIAAPAGWAAPSPSRRAARGWASGCWPRGASILFYSIILILFYHINSNYIISFYYIILLILFWPRAFSSYHYLIIVKLFAVCFSKHSHHNKVIEF